MIDIPYVLTKETFCPECGEFVDCATHMSGKRIKPKAGDLTLCIACGSILAFAQDLGVVIVDEDMLKALDEDQADMLKYMSEFIKQRRADNSWPKEKKAVN